MARILKAKIRQISLCPKGANMMPVIYKSDDQRVELDTLVKSDIDEQGEVTAVVYAPDNPDADGDYASRDAIKEMCNEFPVSGEGVDIRHDGKVLPKEKAYVAQSFIVDEHDSRFQDLKKYDGSDAGNLGGAWAVVVKIDDPDLREAYREGHWQGVSMAGPAVIEEESHKEKTLLKRLISIIKNDGAVNDPHQGEIDMDSTELKKALDEQANAIVKGITEALKEPEADPSKGETDTDPDPEAPVFKGDFSDEEQVRQFEKELRIYEAEKEHGNDPVALFKARREIEKEFASDEDKVSDSEAGIEKEDSAEVKKLKRDLAKEQKRSNQPTDDIRKDDDFEPTGGIKKEDQTLASSGASAVRKMLGEDK